MKLQVLADKPRSFLFQFFSVWVYPENLRLTAPFSGKEQGIYTCFVKYRKSITGGRTTVYEKTIRSMQGSYDLSVLNLPSPSQQQPIEDVYIEGNPVRIRCAFNRESYFRFYALLYRN